MSGEYKKTLARFESAIREHERVPCDATLAYYEAARRALVSKLQYREASAFTRLSPTPNPINTGAGE